LVNISKCQQNSDGWDTNDNIGNYVFSAIIAGLTIFVLVLLAFDFSVVYQIRRRRNTDLFMKQPVENSLAVIIEERLQNTSSFISSFL
jgi:heme/copper-type cytochrome/quinol oxidase subunit 2